MGLVVDTLVELISRQVQRKGIVIWYDPEGCYVELAGGAIVQALKERWPTLSPLVYEPDRGFFGLRHALEEHWSAVRDGTIVVEPPRLLVYVPGVSQGDTAHALVEFEATSAVLQPHEASERNTALEAVARRALGRVYPAEQAQDLARDAAEGRLSVDEIDRMTQERVQELAGPLAMIYGTGNPQDLALRFLSDPTRDEQVLARKAHRHLTRFLETTLGATFEPNTTIEASRQELARHVLTTEFATKVGDRLPAALARMRVAPDEASRDACMALAELWRLRADTAASYIKAAERVGDMLDIAHADLLLEALDASETFPQLEHALMAEVQERLRADEPEVVRDLIERRRDGFWARQREGAYAQEWEVLATVADLLIIAERIEDHLERGDVSAAGLVDAYTKGEDRWCKIDTHYRRLRAQRQAFRSSQVGPELWGHVCERYVAVTNMLAERFVEAYAQSGYQVLGVESQREVFARHVKPELHSVRTAYLIVDALRYEMADELRAEIAGNKDKVRLRPALAVAPTITVVGMAALMPRAEKAFALKEFNGSVACEIGDVALRTRQDRMAYVAEACGVPSVVRTLDQLLGLGDGQDPELAEAQLAVITSQEIDQLCETGQSLLVNQMMRDMLHFLRQACHVLGELGYRRIVVTADHGYLLVPEVGSGQKIDTPGGRTVELHRRCWIGNGGGGQPAVLRVPLADLGVESSLELAVPRGLGAFKARGGGTSYFHGGLSLQEVLVPVAELKPSGPTPEEMTSEVVWRVDPATQTVSSRLYRVTIRGDATELLPLEPRKVRIELLRDDRAIAHPFRASYGFEKGTADVEMRPDRTGGRSYEANTVLMLLDEDVVEGTATLRLTDALTGRRLALNEGIPVAVLD